MLSVLDVLYNDNIIALDKHSTICHSSNTIIKHSINHPDSCRSTLVIMDANFQFNNPFPSAQQSQHLVDNSSPSINSDVALTCVHIREEDSHCEQCRQQIRSMSRSMLQQSPQFSLTPSRQSIDPAPADQEIFRTINDSKLDFHIYNSWLAIYSLEMLN